MSNTKISALTSATTPLAGTEVLPIVQSGATTQVTVANLTAGRAVNTAALTASGLATLSAGVVVGAGSFATNKIYTSATNGLLIIPVTGSTNDFYLSNPGGASIVVVPTGTKDIKISAGNLVQGTAANGINFTANTPAAGMTSQLLNWYEEGTWTPTIQGLTIVGTTTYTTQSGKYTRVGRQVTCTGVVAWTAATGTGSMVVGGLPFTATSVGASATIGYAQIGVGDITSIAGVIVGAASYFNLYKYATGVSANITVETTGTLYFSITYFVG